MATALLRLDRETLMSGVEQLCARDPHLAAVVREHGQPPLWVRPPGFATLSRIILEQQVSLKSAHAIYRRLGKGVGGLTASRVAGLEIADLQQHGLTRQKASYIHGLARSLHGRELRLRTLSRSDDLAARETLLGIRGVGPWTADIYMIMALRRVDVWPVGDLALNTSMMRVKRLRSIPSNERASRIAMSWQPWRTVAAHILWHHYLSWRNRD
jgi:DNA-3-methyladenine glycosylase II